MDFQKIKNQNKNNWKILLDKNVVKIILSWFMIFNSTFTDTNSDW